MQGSCEKLTIAEFAARAGCTTQRIYQLLHNSLQPFAIEENGRKYILSDGIEVVTAARKKQGFAKSLQEDLPRVDKGLQEAPNNEEQAKIEELTAELNELRAALDAIKPQAAALIIDNDRLKQDLEKTVNELQRTRADLEAAREQRQKMEIRAAAAEAAADAERKRAESECKRADAAEKQCTVKDDQAAQQAQTVTALTAALQTAQEQAASLTKALDNSQALQAGQIRLAMQDDAPDIPADQQPQERRGIFGGLFHRRKKE